MSEDTNDVIVRFTGDDYPHPLLLSVKKAGETTSTPLDLSLATTIQWSYKKADANVVTYTCTKDSDPLTGIIYIPFVAADVTLPGDFEYDVQVVWAANSKKQTVKKSLFMLNDDINKG